MSSTSKETSTTKKADAEQFGPANDTLAAGHPAAGYVRPDLSFHDGTGVIPDDLKTWHEERNDAREKEAKEVAESEKKAAKEEREQQAELQSAASASSTSSSSA